MAAPFDGHFDSVTNWALARSTILTLCESGFDIGATRWARDVIVSLLSASANTANLEYMEMLLQITSFYNGLTCLPLFAVPSETAHQGPVYQ